MELATATDRVAIDAAQDTAEIGDHAGVESTALIGRLIRDGMKEVNYLDAIMHNKYARVPEKLRAWQSASHIERAPQREKPPPRQHHGPPRHPEQPGGVTQSQP